MATLRLEQYFWNAFYVPHTYLVPTLLYVPFRNALPYSYLIRTLLYIPFRNALYVPYILKLAI